MEQFKLVFDTLMWESTSVLFIKISRKDTEKIYFSMVKVTFRWCPFKYEKKTATRRS